MTRLSPKDLSHFLRKNLLDVGVLSRKTSPGNKESYISEVSISPGVYEIFVSSDSPGSFEGQIYFGDSGRFDEENSRTWVFDSCRNSESFSVDRKFNVFRFDVSFHEEKGKLKEIKFKKLSNFVRFNHAILNNIQKKGFFRSVKNSVRLAKEGRFFEVLKNKLASPSGVSAIDQDYKLWRQRNLPKEKDIDLMREKVGDGPKISIIVPTYNSNLTFLKAAIESVRVQYYQDWELILSDDGSKNEEVRSFIRMESESDPRIKFVFGEKNEGISAASNRALDLASGEYTALLDHDDVLEAHSLLRVAYEISLHPEVDMLYSDEDKLSPSGEFIDPFFKPDWAPDYFLACMYTCHLGVYRTSILKEIGGFRSEFDFAQDYDLALRFIRRTKNIQHIPDVLYHWRVIPSSTASGAGAKPKAHQVAQKALKTYLKETGFSGKVEDGFAAGFHRIRFDVPEEKPMVSIVIPTGSKKILVRGKEQYVLKICLESIYSKTTYANFEVIVLDDDDIPAELKEVVSRLGAKLLHFKKPFNFSSKINMGVAESSGDYLLLLNDDIEVISPDWIEEMLGFASQENVGAVGAKLLFPNRTLQHIGISILNGEPGHPFYGQPEKTPGYFNMNVCHRNVSAVTAACMLTKRDYFNQVKGFDENFPLNYNDVDYCLKLIESGKRIVYTPYAELYHFESVSKSGTYSEELVNFQRKWGKKLEKDPFCNPHLVFTDREVRINTDRNRSYLNRDTV